MKEGFLLLLAVSLLLGAGCTLRQAEDKGDAGAEGGKQVEGDNAGNAGEGPTAGVDVEEEARRVYEAVKRADQVLLAKADAVEIGEGDQKVTYYVLKEGQTADTLKEFYLSAYTPEYADQVIANYLTEKEGIGTVLILPEDFVDFSDLKREEIAIAVEGENATATATVKGKKVTYELTKVDGNWLVAGKSIQ